MLPPFPIDSAAPQPTRLILIAAPRILRCKSVHRYERSDARDANTTCLALAVLHGNKTITANKLTSAVVQSLWFGRDDTIKEKFQKMDRINSLPILRGLHLGVFVYARRSSAKHLIYNESAAFHSATATPWNLIAAQLLRDPATGIVAFSYFGSFLLAHCLCPFLEKAAKQFSDEQTAIFLRQFQILFASVLVHIIRRVRVLGGDRLGAFFYPGRRCGRRCGCIAAVDGAVARMRRAGQSAHPDVFY